MSGPLSSNEVEDVVSSVRRLVSTDARPRPLSRDLGQDRLVLTPALRVVGEPPAGPLILTHPTIDPVPEAPMVVDVAPDADAAVAEPVPFEADWEDEIWLEPEPPLAEIALGAEEAELVSAAEDAPAAWDDGPWPDEAEVAAVVPLASPARPATDPANDTAPPVQVAETEAVEEALAQPGPSLFDKDGNPLTVLDEDALHEIVRQLIREELQGALGERITRNVRKLVRAEINRALTARTLD